jgi:uncharacterized membrane protein YdjX (TVP38/TMEM64 family)
VSAAPSLARRASRRVGAIPARGWLAIAAAGALVAGATACFYFTELEWAQVQDWIADLPVLPLLALMVLLPPFGFSISLVYLVAGARFGPWVGGAVIAGVTAAHLLLMHVIGRGFLRRRLERLLARRHHRLPRAPEGENVSLSVMAVMAPGLPYFSRNYLLALADVPLRVYFWVCLPLYVLRSYVSLFIGDLARSPDARQLALLIGFYALKLGICAYIIWRIRRRLKQRKRPA